MGQTLLARWVLVGFTLVGVLLGSLVAYSCSPQGSVFLTTSSPQGTYTVNFEGKKERPLTPLVDHSVRFSVFKEARPFLLHRNLHSGDSMDLSFEMLYPQHAWLNDKTLHLYRDEYRQRTPLDMISVTNNSDTKIGYLLIQSLDAVIMLEADPRSTLSFSFSRARGDLKWISVEGEFIGGRKISKYGVDFKVAKKTGPFTFQVLVSENGVTIENPQLEKLK